MRLQKTVSCPFCISRHRAIQIYAININLLFNNKIKWHVVKSNKLRDFVVIDIVDLTKYEPKSASAK